MRIKEVVAERIAASSAIVEEAVIAKLTEEVVNKRVDMILQAFQEIDKAEKARVKLMKPDQVLYYETGEVVSQAYSKDAQALLAKAKQREEKLRTILDLALEKNDYSGLSNMLASGQQGKVNE
jgi:sulfate adenylyltransferase subunit 1 (EFTu-like GTPase family)